MRLVLDKIEEMNPGNLKLKQFAGDLANTLKSSYETQLRPKMSGGVSGAGQTGSSFFESLGLTGIAKAYKDKQEAKEKKRQDKEQFVGNFQKYSEAGQTLSADTSRQVAESLFEEIADKRAELKRLQDEEAKIREAGYKVSEENLKKQKELVDALKNIDPAQQNKPENSQDKDLQQIKKTESETEAVEVASQHFEVQKKESEDITALYTITDDHFKKMDKRTEEMLDALKTIAQNGTGGGGLADVADAASNLMGRGGKAAEGAGKVGKAASAMGKLGKIAKVGGGVLAVGTAAYDAYGDYSAADEAVKRGEITKEEGQVKKGEAVGGGVGAAGGALAGAKAGAMLGAFGGPVGMAIGGLLGGAAGYVGGKWLGQKAGGGVVSATQGGTTAEKPPAQTAAPEAAPEVTLQGVTVQQLQARPEYQEEFKKLTSQGMKPNEAHKFASAKAKAAMMREQQSTRAEVVSPSQAGQVSQARKEVQTNQDRVDAAQSQPVNNTMVHAPTNNVVNNANQPSPKAKETKNTETTYQKYLDRRYYPA